MAFEIIWHEKALGDLKALEKQISRKIIERIKNYLAVNPQKLGKPLKGILKGLYRYRLGDYRIIYTIDLAERKLIILHIAHRKKIYTVKSD
ncbi:MAG TPA: type II toxin-antitoxin system RelE/ParE family toxin [Candidatus Aminicenantes bacterium]|nr:type II toxin-antitoxin system RelE/ParE family toxin [Candidatus Aminicenantes bacterium]